MLIVEWKRGLSQSPPTSRLGASGMFVFTHSENSDQLNMVHIYSQTNLNNKKKKKNNTTPTFLTLTTQLNVILASSLTERQQGNAAVVSS